MKTPVAERFWKYIIKGENDNDCWKWTAGKKKAGYGTLRDDDGASTGAHRISYKIHFGDIPSGFHVCHRCDNPECCNPVHLWVGTPQQNIDDKINKNRQNSNAGTCNPRAKLTELDVINIRKKLKSGYKATELLHEYPVSLGVIGNIKHRRLWKHL